MFVWCDSLSVCCVSGSRGSSDTECLSGVTLSVCCVSGSRGSSDTECLSGVTLCLSIVLVEVVVAVIQSVCLV